MTPTCCSKEYGCCEDQGCSRAIGIICLVLSTFAFLFYFVALVHPTFAEAGFFVHNIIGMLIFGAAIGFNIVLIVGAGTKNPIFYLYVWWFANTAIVFCLCGLFIAASAASSRIIGKIKNETQKDAIKLKCAWEEFLPLFYDLVISYILCFVGLILWDKPCTNQVGQNPDHNGMIIRNSTMTDEELRRLILLIAIYNATRPPC